MLSLCSRRVGFYGTITALVLIVLCVLSPVVAGYQGVLKRGMKGEDVQELQDGLIVLGFLEGESDGLFGQKTLDAVTAFQRTHSLHVDGVVGADTWSLLEAEIARLRMKTYIVSRGDTLYDLARRFSVTVSDLASVNNIRDPALIKEGQELLVPAPGSVVSRGERGDSEMLHWDSVNRIFKVGSIATITDVRTGLSFRVRRRGGSLHADVEPYTKEDTAIMRRIYGGSWSWNRRPIIVRIGGRRIAASMNGMPHGGQSLGNNNFNGHFCLHFSGSKLHCSRKPCPEHQKCVREAAGS
ncbi:MAG: LysM peptidoglycan-binding domain-containing protein [Firmicutes bacterium]|nr:LysM peptidoglycan-binding domain-containing protein [Bacillota bacterium]